MRGQSVQFYANTFLHCCANLCSLEILNRIRKRRISRLALRYAPPVLPREVTRGSLHGLLGRAFLSVLEHNWRSATECVGYSHINQ